MLQAPRDYSLLRLHDNVSKYIVSNIQKLVRLIHQIGGKSDKWKESSPYEYVIEGTVQQRRPIENILEHTWIRTG